MELGLEGVGVEFRVWDSLGWRQRELGLGLELGLGRVGIDVGIRAGNPNSNPNSYQLLPQCPIHKKNKTKQKKDAHSSINF